MTLDDLIARFENRICAILSDAVAVLSGRGWDIGVGQDFESDQGVWNFVGLTPSPGDHPTIIEFGIELSSGCDRCSFVLKARGGASTLEWLRRWAREFDADFVFMEFMNADLHAFAADVETWRSGGNKGRFTQPSQPLQTPASYSTQTAYDHTYCRYKGYCEPHTLDPNELECDWKRVP